tara:strand:- start:16479 stop:17462 length:984 start_codon:yes stop_codon:yes gene_type:complete
MILFVFSEIGSANFLIPVIKSIKSEYLCVCTKPIQEFIKNHSIVSYLDDKNIDFSKIVTIICGTSLNNKLESKYLSISKKKKIKSISIVDHWTNFNYRFKFNKTSLYPDFIFVNDIYALKYACDSGISKDKIVITGNPHLEKLSNKQLKPIAISDWKSCLESKNQIIVTFISESYKDDFPVDSESYEGFDEFDVLNDLIRICEKEKYFLVIRNHPSESKSKYLSFENKNIKVDIDSSFDTIISNSNFIVGMGSMFLIEASFFRNDIISYRPNEKIPFIGNDINMTKLITTKHELELLLSSSSNYKTKLKANNYHKGSLDKILNFIKK